MTVFEILAQFAEVDPDVQPNMKGSIKVSDWEELS